MITVCSQIQISCHLKLMQHGKKKSVLRSEEHTSELQSRFDFPTRRSSDLSGLEYEEKRQAKILSEGGKMEQETRRYDEKTKKTTLMRIKDSADDYRLFPDPDIVPLEIDAAWKEKIRA